MGARARLWLIGLFAGLFALATLQVPADHARAVLQQAVIETVTAGGPHGTHGHGTPPAGHDRHQFMPACMACVVMGAPGLTAPVFIAELYVRAALVTDCAREDTLAAQETVWAPQRARAPPDGSIA